MSADPTRRPVSGEIMTGAARHASARAPFDVVDAEVLDVSPSRERPAPAFASAEQTMGLTMLGRANADPVSRRAGAVFWTFGLALAASAFWVSGGHALMRSEAPLAAAGKLEIAHVETRIDTTAGRTTLVVDGEARNGTSTKHAVPPIGIAVTGHDGKVTRYTLSTGGEQVAANDIYLFSSRLRVPPEGVKSVAVTLQPVE